LVQVCPTLQRSYTVKAVQKELNKSVDIIPVPDGAYRPLKATLSTILAHEVQWIARCWVYMCVIVIPRLPWFIVDNHPETRGRGVVIDDKSWQLWYKCYISYLIG